ncbi:MAG: DUF423 domain-containing protein [Flavobacteriales bacterium]|jgi:uncharacterized membrane protein YgdD (TMEM256/DUF423 family)|nr:DUF423 domain-containing protein [Flavobacteriales bacterium]
MRNWIVFAAILAALTVILGAIGAHTLRNDLSAVQLNSFATGVRYQMYHIFAILATVVLSKQFNVNLKVSLWLFTIGILFFSGSIFLLSTIPVHGMEGIKALGPVTPIGGLVLIAAWLTVAVQFVRKK